MIAGRVGRGLVTTFDRYLLSQFFAVFAACIITLYGLTVTIDLLERVDEFLDAARNGQSTVTAVSLVTRMASNVVQYYGIKLVFFFDRAGPALTVLAVVVTLILLQRSNELHPMLAAGVSMYRVLFPVVLGAASLNTVMMVNRELVVPRIAHHFFEGPSQFGRENGTEREDVEPVYDYSTRISLGGRAIRLADQVILDAEFVLPAPTVAHELTILQAAEAVHLNPTSSHPEGWLLRKVTTPLERIRLTEHGQSLVRVDVKRKQAFVATPVGVDQLFKRGSSYSLLSTLELIQRTRCPAYSALSVQRLVQQIHSRITQPLINLAAILIVIPLMVRRESTGLVLDSTWCGLALAALFGIDQACGYLGQSAFLPADLAAWLPVVCGGGMSAWLAWLVRT